MKHVVDFHSHILPGIDDGSSSVAESIAMLKMEAAQGIHHVIATPHFYAQQDTPERFLVRRKEAEMRLREEMEKHEGLPQLRVGAEVYYFPGMRYSEVMAALAIEGKRCVLIEMPAPPWTNTMYQELEEIQSRQGFAPIVAHVDRYISPLRTHHIPERLEQLPVLVQANASFFLNGKTRRMALKMLCQDRIHLLGSDCHNMKTRLPNLGEALDVIEQHLGNEGIANIAFYQDEILSD